MRQTAEIIQSLANDNWHNLYDLTPGIHYKSVKRGNAYVMQKGEEKIFDSQDLVSYWSFDEATSTIAYDNQSSNNGTLYNGPTWQAESNCISGSCLSFNGSNNYINAGNPVITNNFTVEAWAKVATTSPRSIIGTRNPSDASFDFKFKDGNLIHGDIGNGTTWITTAADASFNYQLNTWYHLAYVVTPTGYTIYVNGNQVGSGSYAANTPVFSDANHAIAIGAYRITGGEYFSGLIDEPRIYNRALTADEIKTHYNAGLDKLGLVSYWAMDENATTTAYDSQSTNNGTLYNSPTWQTESNCISGSCLSFNGSSNYVEIGDSVSLIPSEITIETWIYPLSWTHTPTAVAIVTKRTATSDGYFFFYYLSTNTINIDFGGSTNRWNTGYQPPLNVWTHLVYTFSTADKGKFYVNGNLYNTTTNGIFVSSTAPLRIGMDSINNQYWFKGLIDEPRIYNRALTAEEISQRYQASYTKYFVTNKVSRATSTIDIIYNSSNDDPSTLKINSVIKYGRGLVSQQTGGITDVRFYLTRSYNNQIARQNDWSGGSEVEGPTANFGNTYYSSSDILTDYTNKLINNGFDTIESGYSPGWDVNLNGTYRPASNTPWSTGYNGGVSSPTIGYHAHINSTCGIGNSPCFEYIDENCQYGFCHRWLGVAYPLGTPSSLGWSAGRKVTVKLYGKVNNVLKPVTFGLYYYNIGGTVAFHSGLSSLYVSQTDTWELKEYVFTLISDIDITKNISLYIYGQNGTVEGRLWVDNVVVQNGPQLVLALGSSSGELISSILDTGVSGGAGFNSLLWQGSGSVKFQIAFSTSSTEPWTYYGCTSDIPAQCLNSNNWTESISAVAFLTASTSYPFLTTGTASPQNNRYLRYKVYLATSTPLVINDIIINWAP